jgi:hypothetical protein
MSQDWAAGLKQEVKKIKGSSARYLLVELPFNIFYKKVNMCTKYYCPNNPF